MAGKARPYKGVSKLHVFPDPNKMVLESHHRPGDRFMIFKNKQDYILATMDADRILVTEHGVPLSIPDALFMVDREDRTGIGPVSLPPDHWTTLASKTHDHLYSSPVFQKHNPRSRAEKIFDDHLELSANTFWRKLIKLPMTLTTQLVGWYFWDIKQTRHK